jgi:glutamyl-tRNA synthetase
VTDSAIKAAPVPHSAGSAFSGQVTGPVRVRIAPSPTGDPHVGTAYIALFNYVFARKHGGQFILRIEDTDQVRSTRASEAAILRALRWIGLSWDEGPDRPGPYGPYRQSERTEIYQRHCQELVDRGAAYPCFCTPERLEASRKARQSQGVTGYDRFCRGLDPAEVKARLAAGEKHVIRLAMPTTGETRFVDGIRGPIVLDNATIDDQVLLKSDGFPTYHLANVVDDHLMQVSHVIRAEEWIISTPKHVQLYQAFGWTPPAFLHMPLLRNPDRSKISKRKNPVSLDYYRDAGFFPEALLNFLALMGFAFGGDREKFTLAEMIEVFDFAKVSAGEPVFDLQKLSWLNGLYLREMAVPELLSRLRAWRLSDEFLLKILPLAHQRIERMDQLIPGITFFLTGDLDYEGALPLMVPKTRDAAGTAQALADLTDFLEENVRVDWTPEVLEKACREFCDKSGWKSKELFMAIRVAVTGRVAAPPLFDTMVVVGKDLTRRRLRLAAAALLSQPRPATADKAPSPEAAPAAAGKAQPGAGKPAAGKPAAAAAKPAAANPAVAPPAPPKGEAG